MAFSGAANHCRSSAEAMRQSFDSMIPGICVMLKFDTIASSVLSPTRLYRRSSGFLNTIVLVSVYPRS